MAVGLTLGLVFGGGAAGGLAAVLPFAVTSAQAATETGGNTNSEGVAQAYTVDGLPGLFYCASPGSGSPTSPNQTNLGEQGYAGFTGNNPVGPSAFFSSDPDNHMAGLSFLTDQGQDPNDNAKIVAVAMAVKYFYNSDALYAQMQQIGYSGANDLHQMTAWEQGSYSGAADLAVSLYNQAQAITSGANVSAGTVTVTGNVDQQNNYNGTITVTPTVAGGHASFTLSNMVLADTGASSWSGALAGPTTFQVRGVPNGTPGYKVAVTGGKYTIQGSGGYAPTVQTVVTPGAQTIVLTGGKATGSASTSFSWDEPAQSSAYFSPILATKVGKGYYLAGENPLDNLTPTLQKNPDGTTNEWFANQGIYAPYTYTLDLYHSDTPITQSGTVPAGATLYATGTATVGGTSTDPTTQTAPFTSWSKALPSSQELASGHWTVVAHSDAAKQKTTVQTFLPKGYNWTSDFGIADESFISPPAISTKSGTTTGVTTRIGGTDVPSTGVGLPVSDTFITKGNVAASDGFYAIGKHYTFKTTVDGNGDAVTPSKTQIVCDASTLDYTSSQVPITKAGPIENAVSFHATNVGVGTWVEELYAPDGALVSKGDCGDKNEWTFVKQLLVVTQAAIQDAGKATDVARMWGTVECGSKMLWNFHRWDGKTATSADKLIKTTKALGLPCGLANGFEITSPAVDYDGSFPAYFTETALNMDAKVISQGKRGVPSESLIPGAPTPKPTTPTAVTPPTPAPDLPVIAG